MTSADTGSRHPSGADVSIVIVSYNTRDLLRRCLEAAADQGSVASEAFVVDNGSIDGSAEMVAREYPGVHLIVNGTNKGFAAASNQAIERAGGRYLLLLNPDAILERGVLESMVGFLDAHPDAAVCGPRLLLPDGSLQSCGRDFPTLGWELRQSRTIARIAKQFNAPAIPSALPEAPFEADWVEGCCLLIRREVVSRIGPLDERFFLYAEELDWCRAARLEGWRVFALPSLHVVHYRGASTQQRELESLSDLVETRLAYFQKYHGMLQASVVASLYSFGYLTALAGEEGPRARAKLRGVWRWIRTAPAFPPRTAHARTE
jgi:GT2 family glycosyltransferase